MSPLEEPPQYLSRDVDYLGMLGANLRNLTGIRSLAHELIQNADDSDGASTVSFNFTDEGLVVYNDGVFSDCGSRALPVADCAGLGGLTCDFHSFRLIAGGTKRLREGTTGAFGIGFTAVYQITDRPELISNGAHWILDETKVDDRIRVCQGCSSCEGADGTTFILPWASDPDSDMRRALKVSAVTRASIPLFVQELQEDAFDSLLFLRRLDQLQVRKDGDTLVQIDRHAEADTVIISDGRTDHLFHLLRGSFDSTATKLRARFGDGIESTRGSSVTVAVPEEDLAGLVYAFLPTQISTHIGCHVQADFFPTSDRKRLIFETDYQSEWNRTALLAAASALADGLPKIRDSIGEVRVWTTLRKAFRLHQESADGETHWRCFWDKLRNVAQRGPVTRASSGSWAALGDVTLIELPSTQEALPALEALGVPTVARSIRSLVFEMRGGEGVRPSILTPSDLVGGFTQHGMTRRLDIKDMPSALQDVAMRATLLRELDRMLHQRSAADRERELELLAACTILPGSDGAIWPPCELWRASTPTRALFQKLIPELAFLELDEVPKEAGSLGDLSPELSGAHAARLLAELEPDFLQATVRTGDKLTESLLTWFASHQEDLDVDDPRRMVASLPIYPSAGTLRPLTTLSLPGQFNDPLRLAGILDTSQLEGHLDFIRWLGAADLTLHDYAVTHVPNAVETGLDDELLRRLTALLAEHIGELLNDDAAREVLATLALVENMDGVFRSGLACYFADSPAAVVLGPRTPITAPGSPAARQLFSWLGVESQPRASDVRQRIVDLTTDAPTQLSRDAVVAIFDHLGQRAEEVPAHPDDWKFLRELTWLPAEGIDEGWQLPNSVYAGFSRYLFESQALFLAIPAPIQSRNARLLEILNVESQPTTKQVVDHLLHQASEGLPVNPEVYRRLNDQADTPDITALIGTACLQIAQGKYAQPSHAYWRDHPFGAYRYRLSENLLQFRQLLDVLGVHEEPGWRDAIDVLIEVSADYGRDNQPLDDNARSIVLSCWRLIQDASADHLDVSTGLLVKRKCVPDRKGVLTIPQNLVFQDDQYLAARFQEDLGANLIEREAGIWPAMARAGVQLLSHAVIRSLAGRDAASVAPDLRERVVGRALQLTRVVQSVDPQSDTRSLLQRLHSLAFEVTRGIEVDLQLDALGQRVTKRESVPAFFDEVTNTLSAVSRGDLANGELHWVSFSRELARACCPDDEAGQFTFGFKEVLTAESETAADLALDEAGIAGLTATITAEASSEMIRGLGDDTQPRRTEGGFGSKSPVDQASGELDATETSSTSADVAPSEAPEDIEEPPSADAEATTAAASPSSSSSRTRDPSSGPSKPRAVVTVVPGEESETESDPETVRWQKEVDRSGIRRVLAFERAAGRFPTEMPHDNPGYDIESRDAKGNLLRYIEVKSLGTVWSENVAMTDVQFKFVQAKGAQAWLYVVPEALDEGGFAIVRIQDPTGTATRFRFDRGWSGFAEGDARSDSAFEYGDLLPETATLLSALDERGAPAPTIPYWIAGPGGDSEWKAEAAWPDFRVIVVEGSDTQRDEWLSIQGWTIVLPQEWEVDEVARLLGNSTSETTR